LLPPDDEKNNNREDGDNAYYTKTCPYFSYIKDDGVDVVHCSFLGESGLINGTSNEDYKKLEVKYGSMDEVFDNHPLDLLWDQVKECGEKDGRGE